MLPKLWKFRSPRFPWTLAYFCAIFYFTLLDQPGFIPSVKTLSAGLILALFIPWLVIKIWRRVPPGRTPLDYLFLAMLGLHFISAALSSSFRLTLYSLWLVLVSILLFYFMLDQLQAGREDFLWRAIFLVIALVLELALVEFFAWYLGLLPMIGFEINWPAIAGWTLPPNPRRLTLALPTVPSAPPFSAYVALFIPLAVGLMFSSRRLSTRLGFGAFSLLSFIVLLLTFSRTGLILPLVGLPLLFLLAWLSRSQLQSQSDVRIAPQATARVSKSNRKQLSLIVLLIIILAAGFLWLSGDYLAKETLANRGGSNQVRFSLIQAAILMWRDHPLIGIGPGLFGPFYRYYTSPNPFFLLNLSAHSFYFQLLAEEGLIGLILAGSIAVVAAKTAYYRLLEPKKPAQQWRLLGVVSSLTAFFITALIEQLWWPAFLIPVCLLAAYLFYRPGVESEAPKPGQPLLTRTGLSQLYLVLLIGLGATFFYFNTIAARFLSLTERVEPGQELATAQEVNRLQGFDPGLPIYPLSQAYYKGQYVIKTLGVIPCTAPPASMAQSEQTTLEEAISLYERGLDPIPGHPLYWANLASLYWLNRQPDQAQATLRQAINLSSTVDPKIEIFLLNSGCYYELAGDTVSAVTAYAQLLEHNPHLLSSVFWSTSTFRAKHLPEIIETARRRPTDPHERLLLAIEMALAQNDATAAGNFVRQLATAFPDSLEARKWQAKTLFSQKNFQESRNLADQIQDFQLLGEIALATGDIPAARINFQKEMFIHSDDPEPHFQLAQLALTEGKTDEAIHYLKSTTLPYHRPNTTDSRFIYGYPTNFPLYDSLLIITTPPLQGQPYHLLAELYRQTGQVDLAEEVEQALATYDPYLSKGSVPDFRRP